jgi:hypothetical protein
MRRGGNHDLSEEVLTSGDDATTLMATRGGAVTMTSKLEDPGFKSSLARSRAPSTRPGESTWPDYEALTKEHRSSAMAALLPLLPLHARALFARRGPGTMRGRGITGGSVLYVSGKSPRAE